MTTWEWESNRESERDQICGAGEGLLSSKDCLREKETGRDEYGVGGGLCFAPRYLGWDWDSTSDQEGHEAPLEVNRNLCDLFELPQTMKSFQVLDHKGRAG